MDDAFLVRFCSVVPNCPAATKKEEAAFTVPQLVQRLPLLDGVVAVASSGLLLSDSPLGLVLGNNGKRGRRKKVF